MRTIFKTKTITIFILFFSVPLIGISQTERIALFTDCECDKNYIRQELPYVDHVRDQALADIQLFIFDIGMASGGRSYTLNFTGTNGFNGLEKKLVYETTPTMTKDEVRKGLVRKIGIGLLGFFLESDQTEDIEFSINNNGEKGRQYPTVEDSWGNWIFEIYAQGELEKETSRSNFELEIGYEADKVTEKWRIRTDVELNRSGSMFKRDGEKFESRREKYAFWGSVVRSLSDHWSLGVFSGAKHDTYNNQDFSANVRPAIEYNIFPYSEVLRREITFAYKVGYIYNEYQETTIFGKTNESLFNNSLDVEMQFRQPWGSISANLEASAYLHDLSKNRVEFDSDISVRVLKGLAVRFSTNMELIRDQLTLPTGDASIEDVLLKQKQIATDFEIGFAVGLTYTFGSAFNNIINTRL